jgi:glycosyltransferase involved in cell wall biosynthesis
MEAARPLISVVVPAYNEEQYIGRCLSALAQQQTTYSYEVIVVDNNSTDRTATIATSFPGVRVIAERRQGLVPARQAGHTAATGDIVAHTDADSEPDCTWVESIGRAFERDPELVLVSGTVRLAGGPLRARVIQTLLNWLLMLLWLGTRRLGVVNGPNFAVRAACLTAAGGFAVEHPQAGDGCVLAILRPHGRAALLRCPPVCTSPRRFVANGVVRTYCTYWREYLLLQMGAVFRPIPRLPTRLAR